MSTFQLICMGLAVCTAAAGIFCSTRKPRAGAQPGLKVAVDEHWRETPQGTRIWSGADFQRPMKRGAK